MRKACQWIFVVILAGLASISLASLPLKGLSTYGGIDYHIYWYAGQFLRQGIDPYQAYLDNYTLVGPIRFIDGELPIGQIVAQPGLATIPANTAPVLLILAPLSFLSWQSAWMVFLSINFILMLVIPWLLYDLLPKPANRSRLDALVIGMAFLALFGPRNSAGNGQTSLMVFTLMLLSLRWKPHSTLLAGAALGIALSKYSLALPLFLYFVFQRQWRVIFYALAVQSVALLALAALTHESPLSIFEAYIKIMPILSDLPGIHLGTLFSPSSPLQLFAPLLLSLVTFTILIILQIKRSWEAFSTRPESHQYLAGWLFFSALNLWSLLVAYHRGYDTFVSVTLLSALYLWLPNGEGLHIHKAHRIILWAVLIIATIVLILPASGIQTIGRALQGSIIVSNPEDVQTWLRFHSALITITLLGLLAANLDLITRLTIRSPRS